MFERPEPDHSFRRRDRCSRDHPLQVLKAANHQAPDLGTGAAGIFWAKIDTAGRRPAGSSGQAASIALLLPPSPGSCGFQAPALASARWQRNQFLGV